MAAPGAKPPLWNLPKGAKTALVRCWPGAATGVLPSPRGEKQCVPVDACSNNSLSRLLPGLANPKLEQTRRVKRQLVEVPLSECVDDEHDSPTTDDPVAWLIYPTQPSDFIHPTKKPAPQSYKPRHSGIVENHCGIWYHREAGCEKIHPAVTPFEGQIPAQSLQASGFLSSSIADLHNRPSSSSTAVRREIQHPRDAPPPLKSQESSGWNIWNKRMKLLQDSPKDTEPAVPSYSRKVQFEHIMAYPRNVLFTRPCINDRFSCGKPVESTVEELMSGAVSVEDIPTITVVMRHGRLLTLDHRRLYAFRAALPVDVQVPMKLLLSEWLATRYVPPDCKYYHAVQVEHETPSCSRPGTRETFKKPKAQSLNHSMSRRKLDTTAASTMNTGNKYNDFVEESANENGVDIDCEPWSDRSTGKVLPTRLRNR